MKPTISGNGYYIFVAKHISPSFSLGIIAILIITLFFRTYAAEYYVDFSDGKNNNNGTIASQPFKHCPGDTNADGEAASTILSPGDFVYFKKGVSYKSTIRIKSSGEKILEGSHASITSEGILTDTDGDFSKVTSDHYIYIRNSKESLKLEDNWIFSCGFWKIDSVDSDNHQIILNTFNGKAYSTPEMTYTIINPITFTTKEDWGRGEAVFDCENKRICAFHIIDDNHCLLFERIKIQNAYYDGSNYWHGSITCASEPFTGKGRCDYLIIRNCEFYNLAANGIYNLGSYEVLQNNYAKGVAGSGFQSSSSTPRYSLFEYNVVIGRPDLKLGARSGIGSARFGIVRYNVIKDLCHSWDVGHGNGMEIIGGNSDNDNYYGWIYGNYIENCITPISFADENGGSHYYNVFNNIFVGRLDETGCGSSAITVCGCDHLNIFNNTFYGSMVRWLKLNPEGLFDYLQVKNNIIYATNRAGIIVSPNGLDDVTNIEIDFNHYYSPKYSTPFTHEGDNITFNEWKNLSFKPDAHSTSNISTDPKFIDAPNDLRIKGYSPCKDKGTDLSEYFDFDIRSVARPCENGWDMGAYECTTTVMDIKFNPDLMWNDCNAFQVRKTANSIIFSFHANHSGKTQLTIYDLSGKKMINLIIKNTQGKNSIKWNGDNIDGIKCANGCYLATIRFADKSISNLFMLTL